MNIGQPVRRPCSVFGPAKGLLRPEFFQVAYVTNDIAQARNVFRDCYGVGHFAAFDARLEAGGEIHFELAWAGGIMLELISATGAGTDFYNDRLPPDQFAVRHHHFGYLVENNTSWSEMNSQIREKGCKVALEGAVEGQMQYVYIDASHLGHYLEYFVLGPDGADFFESVPHC